MQSRSSRPRQPRTSNTVPAKPCKVGVTRALQPMSWLTCSFAVFGGAGYTKGGVGEVIERLYREVRAYTLPGGSEEIMLVRLSFLITRCESWLTLAARQTGSRGSSEHQDQPDYGRQTLR